MNSRIRITLIVGITLAASLGPTIVEARCGGTERWAVKVGTDPAAPEVDVGNPKDISVGELNRLPQRRNAVPANDNQLRLPEEKTVYRVKGRLALFKDEEDGDYHLVITDSSGKYTAGGKKSEGKETGTSFIAEIPDPDCYMGKKGNPSVRSHFSDRLVAVRETFEERFPGGRNADADLGGIPVTLVGVAFYDRMHHQTGRSINGIELHPVLDLSFDDQPSATIAAVTPGTATTRENLIRNSRFENGSEAWHATDGVEFTGGYPDGPRGRGRVTLGGYGEAASDSLWQEVHLPADARDIQLSFALMIRSDEPRSIKERRDTLAVQVRDASGKWLRTLGVFSNVDDRRRYRTHEFDLSAYRGQTVRLQFVSREDNENATSFLMSDFRVAAR